MTLPGFTAEVAAAAPPAAYGSLFSAPVGSDFSGGMAAGVVAAAFGFGFPVIRCCRRAPLLGNRFVCVQRQQRPWETCTCTETLTGPVIFCKDNVLTS
jgi:hypothetical protein